MTAEPIADVVEDLTYTLPLVPDDYRDRDGRPLHEDVVRRMEQLERLAELARRELEGT